MQVIRSSHERLNSSTGAATDPVITFGSLFAGIGGFDLGFERAGMVCKWQVGYREDRTNNAQAGQSLHRRTPSAQQTAAGLAVRLRAGSRRRIAGSGNSRATGCAWACWGNRNHTGLHARRQKRLLSIVRGDLSSGESSGISDSVHLHVAGRVRGDSCGCRICD